MIIRGKPHDQLILLPSSIAFQRMNDQQNQEPGFRARYEEERISGYANWPDTGLDASLEFTMALMVVMRSRCRGAKKEIGSPNRYTMSTWLQSATIY